MNRRLLTTLTACLFAALVVTGCSGSPQDRYNSAVNTLNSARKNLNDAQDRVDKARKQMQNAQQNFQQAQQKLQDRQKDLQEAKNKVQKTATDQILFRVLQKDVIGKKRFSSSAISVGVDQRVVTLTGTVPNEKTRKKAVQMVREQPGVASVIDKLTIGTSGKKAPSPSSNGSQNGQNGQSGSSNGS